MYTNFNNSSFGCYPPITPTPVSYDPYGYYQQPYGYDMSSMFWPLSRDEFWYSGSPVRASQVIEYTIVKTEKGFESRKLVKRNGVYYMTERNGREVRIGKLKIKNKYVVNPHDDGTFDALFIEYEGEGLSEAKWISIPYAAFVKRAILPYLAGFDRNPDCPDKYIIAAFYKELREGGDALFLDLPKRSGWQDCNGKPIFAAADKVIPQLADYYPPDILQRKLIPTDLGFANAAENLAKVLPPGEDIGKILAIAITSVLLYFYKKAGLEPDQLFVIEPADAAITKLATALMKTRNYENTSIPPLLASKSALQAELNQSNDGTALFKASSLIEDRKQLAASMDVLLSDLHHCDGNEAPRRHLICVLTEAPGNLPPELPAYYVSLDGSHDDVDYSALQKAVGALESSLIRLLEKSDPKENLVTWALKETAFLTRTDINDEHYQTERMMCATAQILLTHHVITPEVHKEISRFLSHSHRVAFDPDIAITNDFGHVLSEALDSGRLGIALQNGSTARLNLMHTAIHSEKHINLTQEALDFHILPSMTTTKRRNKLLHALDACGKLHHNNNFKRNIEVETSPGIIETVSVYSVPINIVTASCRVKLAALQTAEFQIRGKTAPAGYIPIISLADDKTAGRVIDDGPTEAESIYAGGKTRSGKTYFDVQQAVLRAESGDQVIIFDQTGAFTMAELYEHLPLKVIFDMFSFWPLHRKGLPVNLLSLDHCLTLPEKKNRLFSIFSVAGRVTGELQGKYLRKRMTPIIKAIEAGEIHSLPETLHFFNEEDPDQAELHDRLEEVFEDMEELPMQHKSWGEFLATQKPIVVISTAADGIRKSGQHIDMLLASLYAYKQYDRKPRYTVVLDELEDLCLEKDGPISTILRKGGKHRLSMLLSSQEYSADNDKLGKLIGNCGMQVFFHPKDANLSDVAKFTGVDRAVLANLEQGECVAVGGFYSRSKQKNTHTTLVGKTYCACQNNAHRK